MDVGLLIGVLDLIGTFVFALSGAVAGQRRRMDLFGAVVLGFATAVAGGVIRDLIIGAVPPAAFASWHLLAVSILAVALALLFPRVLDRLRHPVLVLDAIGLGVFAVTGTQKALEYGLEPVMAAVLGMISGIGGGMLRDILTGEVPVVLRSEIYALAALAGAAVVAIGAPLGAPIAVLLPVGIAACLTLRLFAIYRGWHLPLAGGRRRAEDEASGDGDGAGR